MLLQFYKRTVICEYISSGFNFVCFEWSLFETDSFFFFFIAVYRLGSFGSHAVVRIKISNGFVCVLKRQKL